MMIEAVVAGNSVGNSDSEKIIGPSLKSEHLEADEQGSQRTVGDAAEQASHTDRCSQAGGQSQKRPHDRPESGADEQGRDDLTALEAGGYGDGGKQYLDQEGVDRHFLAMQALRDHVSAGAVGHAGTP